MSVPRLRMFAGPNGSGKSTIKELVPEKLLGVYINPDEMQKDITTHGCLDITSHGVETEADEVLAFFASSSLLQKANLTEDAAKLRFEEGKLWFDQVTVNSYHAAVAADFLRQRLMEKGVSFSFETVMSFDDKVALLEKAQALGYRTYLYSIATDDPAINVARVKARVVQGGHDVPEDKIRKRYALSLGLLLPALKHTSRAYLFDNSQEGSDKLWVAEVTDGKELELKCDPMPRWFQHAVWEKIETKTLT